MSRSSPPFAGFVHRTGLLEPLCSSARSGRSDFVVTQKLPTTTRCSVLGTRCSVLGTRCSVLGAAGLACRFQFNFLIGTFTAVNQPSEVFGETSNSCGKVAFSQAGEPGNRYGYPWSPATAGGVSAESITPCTSQLRTTPRLVMTSICPRPLVASERNPTAERRQARPRKPAHAWNELSCRGPNWVDAGVSESTSARERNGGTSGCGDAPERMRIAPFMSLHVD